MGKTRKNKKSLLKILSNYTFLLKYIMKYAPQYVVFICFLSIYVGIITFLETMYYLKFISDVIQYKEPFIKIVYFLIVMFILVSIRCILEDINGQNLFLKYTEKLKLHIRADLFHKVIQMDLSCFDNPKFYSDYKWVINDSGYRVERMIAEIRNFFSGMASLILTAIFILTINKMSIVFILLAFIGTYTFNTMLGKIRYRFVLDICDVERRKNYIQRIFYNPINAKEIRLNNIKEILKKRYCEANANSISINQKYGKKIFLYSILEQFLCQRFVFDCGYMINLIYLALILKKISYGSVAALFIASKNVHNNLNNIVKLLTDIQEDSLYTEKIIEFLKRDSCLNNIGMLQIGDKNKFSLEFKNVFFKYPNTEQYVLKNINISLRSQEKIAIVGYNGAGKSTLFKLLLRFYDVSEGEIKMDGNNIDHYNLDSYRRCFGTVFQDFNIYSATIGNNVLMDNVEYKDKETIIDALSRACFVNKLEKLEEGIDTYIGKEFYNDGIDLSGGEKQKLAISRIMTKDFKCIILDEVNSALDAFTENIINDEILNLVQGKNLIVISHRLTITQKVDKIYVMQNGSIAEAGSHNELMKKNGIYAEMFRAQAKKYNL